jgi:endoglucanase
VIGRKPIHLLKEEQRKKVAELRELHVDIGAADSEDALARVRIGDPGVIAADPVRLGSGRLVSRSLDNRLGVYVALEALRRVADRGGLRGRMAAVAAVQEEIGLYGARAAAFGLAPDVAIAVDITPSSDVPGGDPRRAGEANLGGGPALDRGPALNPRLIDLLEEVAERRERERHLRLGGAAREHAVAADACL